MAWDEYTQAGSHIRCNIGWVIHSAANSTRVATASATCTHSERIFFRDTGCTLHCAAGLARNDLTRHTE